MNKKQLVSMWVGIAATCGLGWLGLYVEHFAYMGYKGFFFRAFFVALVTVGLIVTFTNFSLDSVEWLQGIITYGVFTIIGLTTIIFLIVITWERD